MADAAQLAVEQTAGSRSARLRLLTAAFGAQAKRPRRGDISAIAGVLNGSDGAR
jgi:hypothetical protein